MNKQVFITTVVVSILLLITAVKTNAQENHVLKVYYSLSGDEQYDPLNTDFVYVNSTDYTAIIATLGEKPITILQSGSEIVLFADVFASDIALAVLPLTHENLLKERIDEYFLGGKESCYLALRERLTDNCKLKLRYAVPYALISTFNYIFPGNYLFKIMKTYDNKIKIEKR